MVEKSRAFNDSLLYPYTGAHFFSHCVFTLYNLWYAHCTGIIQVCSTAIPTRSVQW